MITPTTGLVLDDGREMGKKTLQSHVKFGRL